MNIYFGCYSSHKSICQSIKLERHVSLSLAFIMALVNKKWQDLEPGSQRCRGWITLINWLHFHYFHYGSNLNTSLRFRVGDKHIQHRFIQSVSKMSHVTFGLVRIYKIWCVTLKKNQHLNQQNAKHAHHLRYWELSNESTILIWKYLLVFGQVTQIKSEMQLRGQSHHPLLVPSVSISGCNSVKSGTPTSIPRLDLQQFHG